MAWAKRGWSGWTAGKGAIPVRIAEFPSPASPGSTSPLS